MDLRKEYCAKGYAVARRLLPPAPHRRALEEFQLLFRKRNEYLGLTGGTLVQDMQALFQHSQNDYLACLRATGHLLSLHDVLRAPEIEHAVRELGVRVPCFNTGPVVHVMSNQLRVEGGYFGQAAHQDFPSTQASLNAVAVWLPLVPVDADFFPLEVVPGSHLRGLIDGAVEGQVYTVKGNDVFRPVAVEPGDVVFFSLFTLHRSGVKGRDGVRIAASIRYEDAGEPTWVARGYPNAYKRSVERELYHPGFPTSQQVADVFGA